MSTSKPRQNSGRGMRTRSVDYEVGYGRPPKEHRFKSGRTGNPKGRPKGAKGEDTIFREVINTRVPMSVRGKLRKVSLLQAVWTKIADDALKGNAKAQTLIINRSRALELNGARESRDAGR